jgi:hypothetical protein
VSFAIRAKIRYREGALLGEGIFSALTGVLSAMVESLKKQFFRRAKNKHGGR